jgi:alpha/beta superfamily hydrolase
VKAKTAYLQSDGLKLAVELYLPSEDKAHPALCICHGIPATPPDPNDRGYPLLAERFCANGFVTLIFNFRGAGKSEGNFDILAWSRDLKVALDFLSNQEIDRRRIYVLGFSGGAAVSVYTAAHDSRIAALATCACPADFAFLARKETAASTIQHFRDIGIIRDKNFPPSIEEWLSGFETISPIRWIDGISPRPLLLVHGDTDELVPVEHAYRLYHKAKEPKELSIVPGAKHKLRLEEKAVEAILNWLKVRG